jgi:hypothetical protein
MKSNKFNLLIVLCLLLTTFYSKAQERVWEETDPFKTMEVWGDRVGENVKVDITCSAPSVNEAVLKARKVALYNYIFVGYDAEGSGASGISKLSENSVYEQDLEFFTTYINDESKGLKYTEGKINTSKPGGEVKDGRKKLIKVTVTITLKIPQIIKDLESQGKIKSMESISDSMGPITVIVKPNDAWLRRLGAYREEDNQGKKQIMRDYSKLSLDKNYNDIIQSIRVNLGSGFKIDDINSQLNNSNNEVLRDNLSNDPDLQESGEEMMARTLQADLYLEVNFEKVDISGGMQKEFSISFTGIDPYTNSSGDMAGKTERKSTSGDNFNALLDATLKAVCNDFRPKALNFLVSRDEKGLPGKVVFKIPENVQLSDGTPLLFSMKFKIEGEQLTFAELVDESIEEIAKGKPQGEQTPLRRIYDVKIPSKVKNRKGKEVTNNYEKFSSKVEEYITENLKNVKAEIKAIGSGRVVVIFRAL